MTNQEIEKYGREIEATPSKWLSIHVHAHTGKTFQFTIRTSDEKIMLGEIKWFGRWRRYAFFPLSLTVFEWECMQTISNVCERLTKDHNEFKRANNKS